MKMITLGDTAIRISRITMVQRPYEYGKWVIRIYTPDKPNGIDGKFNTEQERDQWATAEQGREALADMDFLGLDVNDYERIPEGEHFRLIQK